MPFLLIVTLGTAVVTSTSLNCGSYASSDYYKHLWLDHGSMKMRRCLSTFMALHSRRLWYNPFLTDLNSRVHLTLVKICGTHIEHIRFILTFSVSMWWIKVLEMCSDSAHIHTNWCQSSYITAVTILTFVLVLLVAGRPPCVINVGDSRPPENSSCCWKIVGLSKTWSL